MVESRNHINVTWQLRYRNTSDEGAQWGVIGTIEPIDWSVTRTLGQPASAQVVLAPYELRNEDEQNKPVVEVLSNLIKGVETRTIGISCFREDFPEIEDQGAEQDPVFFGILSAVDVPSNGTIQLQAKDFTLLMESYLVDDVKHENENPIRVFNGLAGAWTAKYPKTHGIEFKEASLPPLTCEYKADDLRTLGDVVRDYLSQHPKYQVMHFRGVQLVVGDPKTYRPHPHRIERPLDMSSVTCLLGPDHESNVYRICAEAFGDGQRTITDIRLDTNKGESATILQVKGDLSQHLHNAIQANGSKPVVTASVTELWVRGQKHPIPGQEAIATIPTALPDMETYRNLTITHRGVISSVTITPHTVDIEIDSNPIGIDQ